MTNIEIMRSAVLDEFIDELKSNKLDESSGFTSVDLRVMEAFDFTPFDVLDSARLAEQCPNDITPLHEGFGLLLGSVLANPAIIGSSLNVAISAIIGLIEKFLPSSGGLLGKIGSFFKSRTSKANITRTFTTTIPGIIAAAYKVSQNPDYKKAKARHNKAVCRQMMKRAVAKAGLTGIIANCIAAYLASPKGTLKLERAGVQAETNIEQTGVEVTSDKIAKEVAVENKLDGTDAKEAAAIISSSEENKINKQEAPIFDDNIEYPEKDLYGLKASGLHTSLVPTSKLKGKYFSSLASNEN